MPVKAGLGAVVNFYKKDCFLCSMNLGSKRVEGSFRLVIYIFQTGFILKLKTSGEVILSFFCSSNSYPEFYV